MSQIPPKFSLPDLPVKCDFSCFCTTGSATAQACFFRSIFRSPLVFPVTLVFPATLSFPDCPSFPGCSFPRPCPTPLLIARVAAVCLRPLPGCLPFCFAPPVPARPFCQNNTLGAVAGTVARGNSAIMLTIWQGLLFGTTFVRSTGVTGNRNRRAKGRGTGQRKKYH